MEKAGTTNNNNSNKSENGNSNKYNALLKSLPELVMRSVAFKIAGSKAKGVAMKPARMLFLLQKGISRINELKSRPEEVTRLKEGFSLFKRMVNAYIKKQYKDISWGTFVKIGIGIIYFLSVIDLIPDFIPVLGFMDDAAVLAWVVSAIQEDLDKFEAWESGQRTVES